MVRGSIDNINAILDSEIVFARDNTSIYNIVSEEIFQYCAGTGTASETAEKIQKKVSLYLLEL